MLATHVPTYKPYETAFLSFGINMLEFTCHEAINIASSDKDNGSGRAAGAMAQALLSSLLN